METKTQQTQQTQDATQPGQLQVVKQQISGLSSIQEIVWTDAKIELIKKMKCPPDTTDDEFEIFLMQCKRTGMDPLIDEADCVPRWVTTKARGTNGQWFEQKVERKVFQPREAGMRARADRFPDYKGIAYAVVREGDHFVFNPAAFKVEHSFNPADPARAKKPIMGAWAHITRADRLCVPVWMPLAERIQVKRDGGVTAMWTGKTEGMIAKCARAEALRIEYPNVWGGQYISEEWEHEEREINEAPAPAASDAPTAPAAAPATKTQQVLQQVQQKLAKDKAAPMEEGQIVQPPAPGGILATPAAQPAPRATPAPVTPAATTKKQPRVQGTYKGLPIVHFDATSLATAISDAEKWIAANPMKPESTEVRAVLDDLQQEQAKRIAASLDANARTEDPLPEDDAPF